MKLNKDYNDLSVITVGKEFPLFKKAFTTLKNSDGSFLEAQERGDGYSLCIYLNGATQEEVDAIGNEQIDMRAIVSLDGLILPMIRLGNTTMIFELCFNPLAYKDDRALQLIDDNNVVTVFLVDSNNNVLKAMRQANFPLDFIRLCRKNWLELNRNNYSERYKVFCETLQSKLSVIEMWNMATDVGYLGESFDIEDINKPMEYRGDTT